MAQRRIGNHLSPGLRYWSGYVHEEYLDALRPFSKAAKVYREMSDDAVVGAMIDAVKAPLLGAEFYVEAASSSSEDKRAAEFLEMNLEKLEDVTWIEHVEEMLEFIIYGFSIAEKVLEKKKDGKFWLKTLIPVGQETLERWGPLDDLGNVISFIQRDIEGEIREADISKLVLMTYRSRKKDPQGKSILRSIYRSWYIRKTLEIFEAIGVERDVGGTPLIQEGENYQLSDEQIENLKEQMENLRVDEADYIYVPRGVTITPYGGGSKVFDSRRIIDAYDHKMRQRFYADFIAQGSEEVGTNALAKESTTFFNVILRHFQLKMLSAWNIQLVPYLFKYNNFKLEKYPKLEWTKPGYYNPMNIAQATNALIGADALTANYATEAHIRKSFGFPRISPEEREKVMKEKQESQQQNQGFPSGETNISGSDSK